MRRTLEKKNKNRIIHLSKEPVGEDCVYTNNLLYLIDITCLAPQKITEEEPREAENTLWI